MPAAALAVVVALLFGVRPGSVLFTCALAGYALWVTLDQVVRPIWLRSRKGEALPRAVGTVASRTPRRLGAYLVHFGVILTFVAIAISSTYQIDAEASLAPGQNMSVGGYDLTFNELEVDRAPHRTSQRAIIDVERSGRPKGTLAPALNQYPTQREPMGTPAVKSTLTHDLYLTVQSVSANGRVGIRAIVTPAVYWIWIGVLVMVVGTAVCLISPAPVTAAAVMQQQEAESATP